MFKHYLKVAFRNLWKCKSQTLISVIGLAVGFACFAIATLWIRYEMTFDSFHKNADRLYRVSIKDNTGYFKNGLAPISFEPLSSYLKEIFPEINDATRIVRQDDAEVKIDEVNYKLNLIFTDSSFIKMFDVRLIEGNMDFLIFENKKIAVTREKAIQLYGNENPVGKTVKVQGIIYTIGAVISGLSEHSNYTFDMLTAYETAGLAYGSTVIETVPGIDMELFSKKLWEYNATAEFQYTYGNSKISMSRNIETIALMPLTSIHYKDTNVPKPVEFHHLVVFAIAGSLLILCTLFNYLTLFVSRFRIRMKELALRIVFGASNRSLFTLLSIEFLMSLGVALLIGVFLIQTIIPYFKELSGINIDLSFIYFESLIYIGMIILISLLTFLLVLYIFRRNTLNVTIRRSNRKMFRRASIVVQLIISIGFAFCTTVILKQMYHLHNTDLGFSMKNRGVVIFANNATTLNDQLRQIPEITETVVGYMSLVGNVMLSTNSYDWNERPANVEPVSMYLNNISEKFTEFYELKLVAGEMLSENDSKEYVLINETAAQTFGWHDPVGKTFTSKADKYIVKGVIKNIYCLRPTDPIKPTLFMRGNAENHYVLFKYGEGTSWQTCKSKILQLIKEKYPDVPTNSIIVKNDEERYDEYLKSENTLLKILTLVSLVCVIVCVFGFVSMVSLTCEERRKEIAIRKINGATIKDILDIFFKEYLTLLVVGALIAFPVGYIVMQNWLEGYVVQTEMNAWIYVSILLALIMAIIACVGGRVYRTSLENPVEAIKS
jgi:hypothetical protein